MRLSWVELQLKLEAYLQKKDDKALKEILENVRALNQSYATKPLHFDGINNTIDELFALLAHAPVVSEEIQQLVRVLKDHIELVIKVKITPLMFEQSWYMDRMKALGYKITGNGECYGLSFMAIQAFFAHDLDTFNQRLQTIWKIPVAHFENDFAVLRAKRQQCLAEGHADEAHVIDQIIIDLYAFFDGIALHQNPTIHLPDEINQPIAKQQDIRKTMPTLMPTRLETSENKPAVCAIFTSNYSKIDLKNYFDLLKQHLGKNDFALQLIGVVANTMHAITVTYDSKTKLWLLVDPNNLPGEAYIDSTYLANALFDFYIANARGILREFGLVTLSSIMMGTTLLTSTVHQASMRSQFDKMDTTAEWTKLKDDITKDWHKNFYDPKDIIWDDKTLLDMALYMGQNDVISHFMTTKGAQPFLALSREKKAKLKPLFLALPPHQQSILIAHLSASEKESLLRFPISNDKMVEIFQSYPEEERFTRFRIFSSEIQGSLLIALQSETAFSAQYVALLKNMSHYEKSILIDGTKNFLTGKKLYFMFSEADRTTLLNKASPELQSKLREFMKHEALAVARQYGEVCEFGVRLFQGASELAMQYPHLGKATILGGTACLVMMYAVSDKFNVIKGQLSVLMGREGEQDNDPSNTSEI
jgi:hypothetical protein